MVSISHAGPPISDREEREDTGVAAFSPAADEQAPTHDAIDERMGDRR